MSTLLIDKALIEQAISAIELAQENLRPHGDNCFLHDDGEYNSCLCGLDSLTHHLLTVTETLAISLAEPAVEPVGYASIEDLRQLQTCNGTGVWCESPSMWGPKEQAPPPPENLVAIYTAPPPPADHSCKFPTCQTEAYQQMLAAQVARDLFGIPAEVPLLTEAEIMSAGIFVGWVVQYMDKSDTEFARVIERMVRSRAGL